MENIPPSEFKPDAPASRVVQADIELAAFNAVALLGATYVVKARFKPYAGMRATAEFKGNEGTLYLYASEGYKAADNAVLTGLAVSLFARVLRRRRLPDAALPFVQAYEDFSARRSTASLSDELRRQHGRQPTTDGKGEFYDLEALRDEVLNEFAPVFAGMKVPSIRWVGGSRRRLGFHDSAFENIAISKIFDSARAPRDVVKYLVYHELLHQKHDVLYERGSSKRRSVHPRAFKLDERKFPHYNEIDAWLERNAGRL